MKRLTVGTLMGVAGDKHDKQVVVKADQMLRGTVQTKPKLRFQALFYHLSDLALTAEVMDEMEFWAVDNDGVVDRANKKWMLAAVEPIIDGSYEPPAEHQRAMARIIEGCKKGWALRVIKSAAEVSLALDQRVLNKEATALDAKYAGDKYGWVSRVGESGIKSQQNIAVAGNLMLDPGNKPRRGKPVRIDKKKTSRMADVTEAEFREVT